jgi:beta-glucosidase/6-phospho-beta-glucosidase/beta-galactosidase
MLAVMVALALAAPSGALASHRQAMILQDDAKLIYSSPQSVSATLQTLKNMGVNRVRVSVVWSLLAPNASASKKPKFNATDPNAYPNGVWFRYDFLDRVATQDGLQVYFQPTGPAPNWATSPRKLPQGYRWGHDVNATDYGQFVQAVANRYDGTFVAPDASGQSTTLPAVRYWGIWNEPNIAAG